MNDTRKGILLAVIAYLLWGLYPLYWTLLNQVDALEILINRMFFSFVTLLILTLVLRRFAKVKNTFSQLMKDKKKLVLLIAATALLTVNWFLFMYAIVSGRIIESSLGYYINPIISILIGIIVLKERLTKYQTVATIIATIGVLFLTITHGAFPWISLMLALTWGFYALFKKIINIDAVNALFIETIVMLPLSSFFFFGWIIDGSSTFLTNETLSIVLLSGAGIITIIPLFLFSKAAAVLPLKTLGFLQYIGPTIQLMVAIFITREEFDVNRLITFSFIWVACIIFSASNFLDKKGK